jgi:AraC-like DNA-binding protein
VILTFASEDTDQQPLIAGAAAPLLASALLEGYSSNLTAEHDLLSDPGVPGALKDAVSFIHRHAAGAVGVNDVAAAVHLTPRAVQYLFRQRLDTTPTEYLRRVRLHRARQDLLAARESGALSARSRRDGASPTPAGLRCSIDRPTARAHTPR